MAVPTSPARVETGLVNASLARWCITVALVGASMLALFLLARGIAGGLAMLSVAPALLLGLIGCGGVAAVRLLGFPWRDGIAGQWLAVLPTVMLVLLCISLTIPREGWGVMGWGGLLWLAFLLEEAWAWRVVGAAASRDAEGAEAGRPSPIRWRGGFRVHSPDENSGGSENDSTGEAAERARFEEELRDEVLSVAAESSEATETEIGLDSGDSTLPDPSLDDPSLDETVLSRWTRRRHEATETLTGLLRAEFAVGERTQTIHLPFCPPWSACPEAMVEQMEGPEATLKVAQLETYGARIDIRLKRRPEGPASVVIACHFSLESSVT